MNPEYQNQTDDELPIQRLINNHSDVLLNEWQNNYGEIVSSLVLTYQEMDLNREAESVLTTWLERNPSDINARKMLEEIQD